MLTVGPFREYQMVDRPGVRAILLGERRRHVVRGHVLVTLMTLVRLHEDGRPAETGTVTRRQLDARWQATPRYFRRDGRRYYLDVVASIAEMRVARG